MSGILGIVKSIIFESSDSIYKVVRIETDEDEDLVVVGSFPIVDIEAKYRFFGEMVFNEKYGLQLKMSSYESISHDTKDGLIAYLSSGKFKGIGPKTAEKIVEAFGCDAIDKILKDPTILKEVGIKGVKQTQIKEALEGSKSTENIFVTLYSYGLTPKMASRLYEEYEDDVLRRINENPYTLIYDLEGFGFIKADALAQNMGFSMNSTVRLESGLLYTLTEACYQKGYTFLTKGQLIKTAYNLLTKKMEEPFDINELEPILVNLVNEKEIILSSDRYYPKFLYDDEIKARNRIKEIRSKEIKLPAKDKIANLIPKVEETMGIKFTTLQKDAIIRSITNKVSIITGGPGTGKTTIIRAVLMCKAFVNDENIDSDIFRMKTILMAPTGKAAKRLGMATNMEARTIHNALGYSKSGEYQRNKFNPIDQTFMIIDESSMIDISLLAKLLDATKDSCQIIFVGDKFQLPSVGPGNCLKEMIDNTDIPTTHLNEIMRQKKDSNIIKLSQMVLAKNINYTIFNQKNEVFFYDAEASIVLDNIEKLVSLFIKKGGSINEGLQILAPMYSGVCGIDKINEMMQEKFNNSDKIYQKGSKKFKVGDKVIQLQNNPELGIMNGDDGYILDIEDNDKNSYFYINFNDKIIKYSTQDLDNLTLGYAISIHKSQGSEYDNVILPLVPSFQIMLKPKLIYTAITRAKQKLIILGKSQALDMALSQADEIRQTSLFPLVEQTNVIYINDPLIPFTTLGEENMENISPYDFMD